MSSGVPLPPGEWQEIDPEDWDEDCLPDGRGFSASLELRSWDGGGYSSRYFAIAEPDE